jgi:serine/threonine protein kinase/GTPase SAR1 family protein
MRSNFSITKLDYYGCSLPEDNRRAIDDYLLRNRETPAAPVERRNLWAKLCLLGEGEAGKTSLSCQLRNVPLLDDRMTDGVEITSWTPSVDDYDLGFMVYDYGGQRIFNLTHPLFIGGANSVYVIVIDPRRSNEELVADLLERIKHSNGNNNHLSVFVVQTRSDLQCTLHISQATLAQLAGQRVFAVSNKTRDGIDELRNELIQHIMTHHSRFEISNDQQSRHMLRILEDHRPTFHYDVLMRNPELLNGMSQASALRTIRMLQRNGRVLWYPSIPGLENIVFTDPSFLVALVRCFVSMHEGGVRTTNGILEVPELIERWQSIIRQEQSNIEPEALLLLLEQLGIATILPDPPGATTVKRLMIPHQLDTAPPPAFNDALEQMHHPVPDEVVPNEPWGLDIAQSVPTVPPTCDVVNPHLYRQLKFSSEAKLDAAFGSFIVRMWPCACGALNGHAVTHGVDAVWRNGILLQAPYDSRVFVLVYRFEKKTVLMISKGEGAAPFVSDACKVLEKEYRNAYRCNEDNGGGGGGGSGSSSSTSNSSISASSSNSPLHRSSSNSPLHRSSSNSPLHRSSSNSPLHRSTSREQQNVASDVARLCWCFAGCHVQAVRDAVVNPALFREHMCDNYPTRDYRLPVIWDTASLTKLLLAERAMRLVACHAEIIKTYLGAYISYPLHCMVSDSEMQALHQMATGKVLNLASFSIVKRLGLPTGEGAVYLVRWQVPNRPLRQLAMKIYYSFNQTGARLEEQYSAEYNLMRLLAGHDSGPNKRFICRALARATAPLQSRLLPGWEMSQEFMTDDQPILMMVMDLFDGDLENYLNRVKWLTYSQVGHLALQLIKALKHLSEHCVAHRDLKAPNIFISEASQYLALGDFGLAKRFEQQPMLLVRDEHDQLWGSPHIRPPELTNWPVDHEHVDVSKGDMYSAGLLLRDELLRRADQLSCDAGTQVQLFAEQVLKAVMRLMLLEQPAERVSAADAERILEYFLWGDNLIPQHQDTITNAVDFNAALESRVRSLVLAKSLDPLTMPEVMELEYLNSIDFAGWQEDKAFATAKCLVSSRR